MKSDIVSTFSPSICHKVIGPDAMILVFWMLSFKPAFSLSSFTLIKRLFSSSLLSVLKVISSAYLRLLIFFRAILIPAYESSSPAFRMMYSACKLNKQGDNMPIWNQSIFPCPVLTVASWPAYRFLRRQVRWSGILISSRIFHSLLWSTQSMIPLLFLNPPCTSRISQFTYCWRLAWRILSINLLACEMSAIVW